MGEVVRNARENGLFLGDITMVFNKNIDRTANRYNLPQANEIAIIFTDPNGDPPFERDFQVYARHQNFDTIKLNITSPHLDPMLYVLFYLFGESGWQQNLILPGYIDLNSRRVTMLQYKASQLAVRKNEYNPLLNGGKLFQQWITDSWLQVEGYRLNYIRNNQRKLRAAVCSRIRDYIAGEENRTVGRPIILPGTFQGSYRNIRERFHDSMAIVTKFGKPDLFITMTCNPKWREITDELFEGQDASDRPDLVAKVFKLKLEKLMEDINNKKMFGNVIPYVYTIEFQKRGLPHAHKWCPVIGGAFLKNAASIIHIIEILLEQYKKSII